MDDQHWSIRIRRSSGRRQKLVSVPCVGRMEQGPGATEGRWKGQVEDLKNHSSYKNAVGTDGEAIEFEWKNFPGVPTLSMNQEIQKVLKETNVQPENFKDQIIFMSMFNDILWKSHDQNCFSNAEKVKSSAKKFLPGYWSSWVQGRKRDVMVTPTVDSRTVQPTKWYSNLKTLVILSLEVPVLCVAES